MSQLARKSESQLTARAWISIAEASARSGESERTLRHRCRDKWQHIGRASLTPRGWLLDPTVDERFLATTTDDERAEVLDIRQVSAAKRSIANSRRQIVADANAFCTEQSKIGVNRTSAINKFAELYGGGAYRQQFSARTLYRWLGRAKNAPTTGLVDRRGMTDRSRDPDPKLISVFQQRWLANKNRPSLRSVYDELVLLADHHGLWFWNTYRSFCRWVKNTYPKAMITYNREGEQAYTRKCEPSLNQDPDAYYAGEMYVGDHHQVNVMVHYRGRLIRPWLSAWMDQRSHVYVGWSICASPNQCTILSAFKHAAKDYGVPAKALMDNGRDYSSYGVAGDKGRRKKNVALAKGYLDEDQVTGLFGMIGTEAIFCLPASPNAKIIESMFRPIEERFCRMLPNFCGNAPADRPDDFATRLARHPESIPDFEQFAADLDNYIANIYNRRPQTGKYCQGHAPVEVFAAHATDQARLADPAVLDLFDMVWSEPKKITRNGITFKGIKYGAWQPEIIARQGEMVRVSYDPQDIGSIGIWSLDYQYICRAEQETLANRNATDEDRREAFRLRGQLKKAMKVVQDRGHLNYADAARLTLAAQTDALKHKRLNAQPTEPLPAKSSPNLRLVHTPIDGQADRIQADRERPELPSPGGQDILERLDGNDVFDTDDAMIDLPALPFDDDGDGDLPMQDINIFADDDEPNPQDDILRRLKSDDEPE